MYYIALHYIALYLHLWWERKMVSLYFDIQERALITDIGYLHKSHTVINVVYLEKVDQCPSCEKYKS